MSSQPVHETDTFAEHTARDINSDFQFIADRLPTEVKEAPPYEAFTLGSVEGIGILWAMYAGQRPSKNKEISQEYVMRIGLLAEGAYVQLGLVKEYGLTYKTLHQEGYLVDLAPIHGPDLENCPEALQVLAFAVRSLRNDYARVRGEGLESTEDIVHIDNYRDRVA